MRSAQEQIDPRRTGLSGLGAISLFLAAVIVLTATPAVLTGQISDPSHPISRVGSQLRRIAAAVPVRLVSRAAKRDQRLPVMATSRGWGGDGVDGAWRPRTVESDGPPVARMSPQFLDLPPPALQGGPALFHSI
jgi:hypothetical protein